MIPVRAKAEHLGGTKVRFILPCGHTETQDFSKGPIPKRIGEMGVWVLVRHWQQGGGASMTCKKCSKK